MRAIWQTKMDDVVFLARMQFAVTTVYHFLFVPLTLGLTVMVAMMETVYFRTDSDAWKRMTRFFGTILLINFAVGVVTGIVQEFQFGMNWSEYSRFVGDIFGAPLAIEALAAFFMESVFLGIWVFGWEKISKKLHLASIWLVAFASNLSAFWILTANSFMQEPVGYALRNGRAEMTDFFALITNPHVWLQFPHVVTGGFTTAAVLVMGVSAYQLLRGHGADVFRRSFKMATIMGLISLILVIGIGDLQGKYLVKHQPMKMAAAEALWESADPAPLSLFSIIDEENNKNSIELAIPYALSFMSYSSFSGEVQGLNQLQAEFVQKYGEGNYIPPVAISFWSFRMMVGAGSLLLLYTLFGLYLLKGERFGVLRWYLKAAILMIPLPYICNSAGWILTEVGRQPWLVYGILQVKDGVSSAVGAGSITISLLGFTLVYGIMAVLDVYLILKAVRAGLGADDAIPLTADKEEVPLWN